MRQPIALFRGEVAPCKLDPRAGGEVHVFKIALRGGGFIVVAHEHRAMEGANPFQAGNRVGTVTHHVSQADVATHIVRIHVGDHRLECFQVGMNVAENSQGGICHPSS